MKIALAGLFAAAALMTPAQATSIVFNLNSASPTTYGTSESFASSPSGYGSLTAYGYDSVLSQNTYTDGENIGAKNKDTPSSGSAEDLETSSAGLGLVNTGNSDAKYIPVTDAVVLDFSNVSSSVMQSATSIKFSMSIDANGPSEWVVLGYNASTQKFTVLDEASMSSGSTASYTDLSTSGLYTSYMIGVSNDDCALTVDSVTVNYNAVTTQQAPEPGTFAMAGMALAAVGISMKKRRKG